MLTKAKTSNIVNQEYFVTEEEEDRDDFGLIFVRVEEVCGIFG